jgi:TolA-binding protein
LILTETRVMTERVKKQALEGRGESNKIAMKLNDLAKRIRTTTRQMMSKVSELSMNQATALSLHQEKTEKEALIQDVSDRMKAAGSAIIPWDDVEIELKRFEKIRARKEADRKRSMEAHSRDMAKTTGQFVDL